MGLQCLRRRTRQAPPPVKSRIRQENESPRKRAAGTGDRQVTRPFHPPNRILEGSSRCSRALRAMQPQRCAGDTSAPRGPESRKNVGGQRPNRNTSMQSRLSQTSGAGSPARAVQQLVGRVAPLVRACTHTCPATRLGQAGSRPWSSLSQQAPPVASEPCSDTCWPSLGPTRTRQRTSLGRPARRQQSDPERPDWKPGWTPRRVTSGRPAQFVVRCCLLDDTVRHRSFTRARRQQSDPDCSWKPGWTPKGDRPNPKQRRHTKGWVWRPPRGDLGGGCP